MSQLGSKEGLFHEVCRCFHPSGHAHQDGPRTERVPDNGNKPGGLPVSTFEDSILSEERGLPVKQKVLIITAALFCLSAFASATDAKQSAQAQAQSQQPTQGQLVDSGANAPTDQASSAKANCTGKQKHSKRKPQQSDAERDYQIQQDPAQVEYGGGG
jgi:hypothetical protein